MERALSDQEKQARRSAILHAAWTLFETHEYAALSMQQIATAAGVAKGTVYLYFKTKESLFLALYEQQLTLWFEEVRGWLSSSCTSDTVAQFLAHSLQSRPLFLRLAALLHPILEYNIDYPTALAFKERLLEQVAHTGVLLEQCLDYLHPGEGARCFLHLNALVIGLQQTNSAPVVQVVLQQPQLAPFRIDLFSELEFILRNLLYGLHHRQRSSD